MGAAPVPTPGPGFLTVLRESDSSGTDGQPYNDDNLYNIMAKTDVAGGFCIEAYKYKAGSGTSTATHADSGVLETPTTGALLMTGDSGSRSTSGAFYTTFKLTAQTDPTDATGGCYFGPIEVDTTGLLFEQEVNLFMTRAPTVGCAEGAVPAPYLTFEETVSDLNSGGIEDSFSIQYDDIKINEAAGLLTFAPFQVWDETAGLTPARIVKSSKGLTEPLNIGAGNNANYWGYNNDDEMWNLYLLSADGTAGSRTVDETAWSFASEFAAKCQYNAAGRTEVAFSVAAIAAIAAALF